MSYKIYFGIKGNFLLPKDFFAVEHADILRNKEEVAQIMSLGLDMTLRQKHQLDDLQKEIVMKRNPYGFDICLYHDQHKLVSHLANNYSSPQAPEQTLFYNVDKQIGSILLHSEDTEKIDFVLFGNSFSPFKLPYSITDVGEAKSLVENIVQACKLSLTIIDRGDEEYGYEEDGCDRELVDTVFINGVEQK